MNLELLYGIYELQSLETYKNEQRTAESATSGMFVFLRDHRLSVVSGSDEMVMAYTGTYQIKEDVLEILTGACVKREREGTTMTRKILKMDGKTLVLGVQKDDVRSVLTWKKIHSL